MMATATGRNRDPWFPPALGRMAESNHSPEKKKNTLFLLALAKRSAEQNPCQSKKHLATELNAGLFCPLYSQVIDMRWGVRDEATDDHQTTAFCLQEIQTCQESSVGPNFVFFGGQKYGYRPIPSVIDVEEFELIVKTLRDLGRDDTVLHEWYEKDENAVPPEMILQVLTDARPIVFAH